MELAGMKKFLAAVEEAGIKNWDAVTDVPSHLYNTDNQFNVLDEETETLYHFGGLAGIASSPQQGSTVIIGAHLGDIHEIKCSGDYETIKAFIEAYGLDINDEQNKILLNINSTNYNLKPMTGDYVFRELSEDEVEALSEEDKAKYQEKLDAYKKSQKPKPIQVTV